MNFYDLSVEAADGSRVLMSNFKGKVVLVVNTATGCGFTPHYKALQEMYEKYHEKGLEIVDVPCNQFCGQAPGTDEEIHQFCTLIYNTGVPLLRKADLNGENEIELFRYLKKEKGFEGFKAGIKSLVMAAMLKLTDRDYKRNSDIKWNFTKFVIDRDGKVVARFEPTVDMKKVEECVAALI